MLQPVRMMTQTPLNAVLSITPSYAFMLTLGPGSIHQRLSDRATACEIFWEPLEEEGEDVVAHCPFVVTVDPADPSSSAFSRAAFASTL